MVSMSRSTKFTIFSLLILVVILCSVIASMLVFGQNSPIHISFGDSPSGIASQASADTAVPQQSSQQPFPLPAEPTFTALPTYTLAPTYTPVPTYTLLPTYTSIATQVMEAMFTANEPAFCRSGPSEQVWWDPQEALNTGQSVKIIGKSTYEWGLWWYIEKPSGTRCWVYSELGSTSGNVAGVPERMAPATPTPSFVEAYLTNTQVFPLCNIWIRSSDNGQWSNLLQNFRLEINEAVSFTVTPGRYDFEIYDCFGNLVDTANYVKVGFNDRYFTTP